MDSRTLAAVGAVVATVSSALVLMNLYVKKQPVVNLKVIQNPRTAAQNELFSALRDFYQKWKADENLLEELALPDLRTYPKDFVLPKVLIRKEALQIFRTFEEWDANTIRGRYGNYVAGPNGVGKSVNMYIIACLALSLDWLVIYVPRCDEWAVSTNPCEFLLQEIARSLYHVLDEPTAVDQPTWRQIINSAVDEQTSFNALHQIFKYLSLYTARPVLLLFDEVNEIFVQQKDNQPFFVYAANLNKITMTRGLKLISGTGHASFIRRIASGLERFILYGQPWSDEEFNHLLSHADWCHGSLLEIMQRKPEWKERVRAVTGNIPRELVLLNASINSMDPQPSSIPNYAKRLSAILAAYEKAARDKFSRTISEHLSSLNDRAQKQLVNNMIQAIVGVEELTIPLSFIDQSVMYYNSKLQRLLPITPMASSAIMFNLAGFYDLASDTDSLNILNPVLDVSEKTKAFERLFAKQLLFNKSKLLKHCNLKGEEEHTTSILVDHVVTIPTNKMLPDISLSRPVLLQPASKLYPIADFFLVDPIAQKIIIIQITISQASAKLPSLNSYQAILNSTRWDQIAHDSFRLANHEQNFAQELLRWIGVDATVSIDPHTKAWVERDSSNNICSQHIEYIIITPKRITDNVKNYYTEFPWVRVVPYELLCSFLSVQVVQALTDE